MIKSLTLENWKVHFNSTINFSKGTNIFVGKIGAGKSSIVDAICYAFYGTYPALQTKKLTIAETIMFKPVKKESAKVILVFDYESMQYRVERELFLEKTNTAKLYLNDKLVAGPKQTDVNDKITEILGIDYNLFIKIVYSEQNEIDYFLKIQPGKRKDQFDSLFGISHLENIKINSRELGRVIVFDKDKQTALLKQITDQLSSFDLQSIEQERADLETKKIALEKEIQEQAINKKEIETEYFSEKDKKQNYEIIKSEKTILDSKLSEITLQLKDRNKPNILESIESLFLQKQNLENQIKEIGEENKKTELLKRSLENQLKFYDEQLQGLDREKKQITSKIENIEILKLQKEKEELDLVIQNVNQSKLEKLSQLKELNKSIEELKKGFSKCPVCDSQLPKEQIDQKLKTKESLENETRKSLEVIESNSKDLLIKKNNIAIQEKKSQENEALKQRLEEMLKKEKELISFKSETRSKLDVVPEKKDTKAIETNLQEIIANIEHKQLLEKKKEIEIKLENINSEITNLNFSEEKYMSIFTEYKNIEMKNSYLQTQKQTLEKQEQNLKITIERYEKLKSDGTSLKSQLEKTDTNIQDVSYFTTAIESSQNQLRKVLVDNINKTLELIWPKVYPYGDYLSARLRAENDYVLEVQTRDNSWIRVEGLLSGGERTCAALSIRVAIALSLTKKLGLLILDEPTHNLDNKTISMLSTILDKDLPELVDQIFIVTHDSKLLETTNASKYTIERDKENDGVSKIIEE